MLLGLARGSGARSLAGMRADQVRGGVRWLRPLLGVRRADTAAACAAERLEAWDDPHNADPAYLRSRLRHGALPALERDLGPGVAAALGPDRRSAAGRRRRPRRLGRGGPGLGGGRRRHVRRRRSWPRSPTAVRTRAVHQALLAAGCPAGSVGAGHVRAVDALVAAWRGQGPVALPGGVEARRDCGRLAFSPGG